MKKVFSDIWEGILKYYMIYSNFVHSIFPAELGDLVVFLIDMVVAVGIVFLVAKSAFGSKTGSYTS